MFFLEHYEVWKNGTMTPSGRANLLYQHVAALVIG